MKARIDGNGNVYQLDRPAEPDEMVAEEDVKDATKLARLLMRVLRSLATMTRRFEPRQTDFEDKAVTSGDVLMLPHKFDARVRWWVVDWTPTTPGDAALFERSSASTLAVLKLTVGNSGLVTIRVEAAG